MKIVTNLLDLAKQHKLKIGDFKKTKIWEIPELGYDMQLVDVQKPGHPLHHSTLAYHIKPNHKTL